MEARDIFNLEALTALGSRSVDTDAKLALLDGTVLLLIAFRSRAGWLHIGALPCLALAVLLGTQFVSTGWAVPAGDHAAAGLADQLGSIRSGLVLAFLVAGLAPVCVALSARLGHDQAGPFGLTTVALGVIALAIATGHGPTHPLPAALARWGPAPGARAAA